MPSFDNAIIELAEDGSPQSVKKQSKLETFRNRQAYVVTL